MLSAPCELLESISKCGLERRAAVVAAASGGSDSTALLLLLKTWLDRHAPATNLIAATVDHGLRPESAREAEHVGLLAAKLGIEHRILRWDGTKPQTGLATAARMARYGLLARLATETGTDIILTGHTADDQAETVFMRGKRNHAGIGLAGMAPATLFDGSVWLMRPLLGVRREALRRYLLEHEIGWFDDPTNANMRYERARTRSQLADAAPEAIDELLARAADTAALRRDLGKRAAALISGYARQVGTGLFHLGPQFATGSDSDAAVHAFRHLLATVGGTERLPDEPRVHTLLDRVANPPHRATLSRAMVAVRRDGIWLCRELRDLPPPCPATNGMIWDGRYRISASGSSLGATIAPHGLGGENPPHAAGNLPSSLARMALACTPAILPGGAELESRQPSHPAVTPVLAQFRAFLPWFDLPLAQALASLAGAQPYPDAPRTGHIVTQA